MSRFLYRVTLLALTGYGTCCLAQNAGDRAFLKQGVQSNINEVELSKLVPEKSTNPKVLEFAHTMVQDHESMAKMMAPFLDKYRVTRPGSLDKAHQKLYNTIKGLSGEAFDREYVKAMEMDHHNALSAVHKELQHTKDADLKTQLATGEKMIAAHTQAIETLASSIELAPPGQTERKAGRVIR